MIFSQFLDIQTAIESFFTSITSALSYNLLFIIGLGVEAFLIFLFSILNRFSYEGRMRRALDGLNRWLFKYKSLDRDNIKEFSNLIKKAPKRLAINWQQYILYREKAPSEYMSAENIIEKPLRTSASAAHIKNFVYISIAWGFITFLFGISKLNLSDTIVNATMLIIALIIPVIIAILCTATVIIMRARKNVNLDELYQNLHLFDRFIDNACVELPPYIDYSLLFTAQEIDKGIPALREYLESRARKEKEEFDKIAQQDAVQYEKYDFDGLGIDGQNILERAMKESEAYLSKKDKTLAKIAQIEATVESLKKNFDNIQKDYQKRMQVSKENIDRLRQQQEETTNRIESNFLRKQQNQEIAKQEKEEADFEQQKRRFLVEKGEYEEVIKTLNEEMESGRTEVEEAMMSEYETFYSKLFNNAISDAEKKVKEKLNALTESNQQAEEELTVKEAQLKRVLDENETLKRKLGIEDEQIEIETAQYMPQINTAVEEPEEEKLIHPEEIAKAVKIKSEEVAENRAEAEKAKSNAILAKLDEKAEEKPEDVAKNETPEAEQYAPSSPMEQEFVAEELPQQSDQVVAEEPYAMPLEEEYEPMVDEPVAATQPEQSSDGGAKRRGRPKKGQEKKLEDIVGEKRVRGRPRKPAEPKANTPAKKRGRPAGTAKKAPATTGEKKGRGRPKKDSAKELSEIKKKIDDEEKRLSEIRDKLDGEIQKAISDLDGNSSKDRRDEIMNEISSLKGQVQNVKNSSSSEEIEEINKKIESLLEEIKKL